MTPERWQQIKPILNGAREHGPAGRRQWLAEACAGDPDLLRDVESFLEHEERLEGFIEEPVLAAAAAAARFDEHEAGRLVGPYRLVRLLGKGGMGAVYLAERREEFDQRVALKLVRRGLLSRETVRRFQEERQILARLEHPNVARLLDGGTTEDGLPYFAMELIEGTPIDRYCDEHALSTRQRLELFLPVCSALSAAHQSLVIHRDLKPGNILVDATGTPKLLDFGIAKRLRSSTDYLTTPMQQKALTLRYASPEQLRDEPVSTASDVYSLGVVLYLVLTGRLPCGLEGLNGLRLMQAVCEEIPAAPSALVMESRELLAEDGSVRKLEPEAIAACRDGDTATLRRRLVGDVDSIVAKALHKEPRDRYGSVEQLADDLRRHLQGLPVSARQGRLAYRVGKFARRHRLSLAAVAAMLVLALGFTLALVRQLHRTEQALGQAESVSSFVIDLFQEAVPNQAPEAEPTMRDILGLGREKLTNSLEQKPIVRATLLFKMGEVYLKLGDYPAAQELLGESIELLRRYGGDHPDLATALHDLATVHHFSGELESAEALVREAIDLRRRLGLVDDLIKPTNSLAAILGARGRFEEAAASFRENLALRRAKLGEHHPNVATSLRSLGTTLFNAGDLEGAEPYLRQAHALRLELFGSEHTEVAKTLLSLGRLEHARGRLDEAEIHLKEALRIRHRNLGEDHHHTATARMELAAVLLERGETATAGVLLPRVLETLYRIRPADDWQVAEAESLLGVILAASGRTEAAEVCLYEAHATLERRRGTQALDTQAAHRRLADFLTTRK